MERIKRVMYVWVDSSPNTFLFMHLHPEECRAREEDTNPLFSAHEADTLGHSVQERPPPSRFPPLSSLAALISLGANSQEQAGPRLLQARREGRTGINNVVVAGYYGTPATFPWLHSFGSASESAAAVPTAREGKRRGTFPAAPFPRCPWAASPPYKLPG